MENSVIEPPIGRRKSLRFDATKARAIKTAQMLSSLPSADKKMFSIIMPPFAGIIRIKFQGSYFMVLSAILAPLHFVRAA